MEDLVQKLTARASEAEFRIKQTKENMSTRAKLEEDMRVYRTAISRLDMANKRYADLLNSIQEYMDERRKDSNTAIISAMNAAAYIVPASDSSLVPKCEGGEAWFETEDGIDVSRLEGSGFRSILSVMMRSVVLRAQPNCLKTLVLDELFSKLSVENSATLSSYLPILAQNMQIISIEQKPEVFADNSHTAYKFTLEGDHTVVQREDIVYEDDESY